MQQQATYFLHCYIARLQYYEVLDVWKDLKIGDALDLIPEPDNLLLVSNYLKNCVLRYCDYAEITPQENDFVYFDSPYHSTDLNSFVGYTKNSFTENDHIQLRDFAIKLHAKGVKVMISNADTPFVRALYTTPPCFKIEEVSAPRFINCKPKKRKNAAELLIRNYS